MKAWIIQILLINSFAVSPAFATPVRIVDGIPKFAISQVSGFPAWTQAEEASLVEAHGGGNIVALVPANYEINLSTTLVIDIDGDIEIKFNSYTEWISCQTRRGLKRKIRKIRQLIDSLSDLPASESLELRQRAGWVKSYYQSLP
ncbi:MAG: hypothetical protein AAB456_00870 [Patescibacteria group bacterium]